MHLMHVEDETERLSLMVGLKCQDGMNPPVTWTAKWTNFKKWGPMGVGWLVSVGLNF